MDKKIPLSREDLENAARAWLCFAAKDDAGLRQLAGSGSFDSRPAMKKALLRLADDVPDEEGLTRTQRQILQLVSRGCSCFREIFTGFDAFEEYPFLGDTACQRHLDFLTAKGFLSFENQHYKIAENFRNRIIEKSNIFRQ